MKRIALLLLLSTCAWATTPFGNQVQVNVYVDTNLATNLGLTGKSMSEAVRGAAATWAYEGSSSTLFLYAGTQAHGCLSGTSHNWNWITSDSSTTIDPVTYQVCSNGYFTITIHTGGRTMAFPDLDGTKTDLQAVIQRGFGKYLGAVTNSSGCISGPASGLNSFVLASSRGSLCDDEIRTDVSNGTAALQEACAHSMCSTGLGLAPGCSDCVTQLCPLGTSSPCCGTGPGAWSSTCVAAVANTCHLTCSATSSTLWNSWGTIFAFQSDAGDWPDVGASAATWNPIFPVRTESGLGGFDVWRGAGLSGEVQEVGTAKLDAGSTAVTDYQVDSAWFLGPTTATVRRPAVAYDPTRKQWWYFVVENGTNFVSTYYTTDNTNFYSAGYLLAHVFTLASPGWTVRTKHSVTATYDFHNDEIVVAFVLSTNEGWGGDAGAAWPAPATGNIGFAQFWGGLTSFDNNHVCGWSPDAVSGLYFNGDTKSLLTDTTPALYCSEGEADDFFVGIDQDTHDNGMATNYDMPCELVYNDVSNSHQLTAWRMQNNLSYADAGGYYGPSSAYCTTNMMDHCTNPGWTNPCYYGAPKVGLGVTSYAAPSMTWVDGGDAVLVFLDTLTSVNLTRKRDINADWTAGFGQVNVVDPPNSSGSGILYSWSPPVVRADAVLKNYNLLVEDTWCSPNNSSSCNYQ